MIVTARIRDFKKSVSGNWNRLFFPCGKQGGLHVTDEIIIIATDNAMTVEELKETVCYVNRNELRQEEILSDNVYRFCRSDGNVEII